MIKNVLNDIGGVGLYGVVSICLFFTVFSGAMLWAFAHRKSFLSAMGEMPLHDEDGVINPVDGGHKHE
jgi:hypothetical protein